jgi:hypothetical protein
VRGYEHDRGSERAQESGNSWFFLNSALGKQPTSRLVAGHSSETLRFLQAAGTEIIFDVRKTLVQADHLADPPGIHPPVPKRAEHITVRSEINRPGALDERA